MSITATRCRQNSTPGDARERPPSAPDPVDESRQALPALTGLLAWILFVCLHFTPAFVTGAAADNACGTKTVETAPQDNKAREKAQRDAAGLITIEGTVVDDRDAPVPKARVRLFSFDGSAQSSLCDSQGKFRFLADLPTTRHLGFLAESLKEGTKGYLSIQEEGTLGLPAPVKIVLKPPRELVVAVNDPKGDPIADAQVEVTESMRPIDGGRTGPDGTIRFKLPAEATIGSVVALKSGRGFDYWISHLPPNWDPRPLPPELSMTLNGARTARVQAIDSAGRPVPGITVLPWTIEKQGHIRDANLSGFESQLDRTETDANGIAVIDWLPDDLVKPVAFLAATRDFHLPQPPLFQPGQKKDEVVELTMKLMRVTTIAGKVLGPDGKPAVGTVLQAEGRGETNHYYRDLARTNSRGEFEFRAYPDQAYLIAVLDENWAAASCTVPQVIEDEPVSGLELQLSRGTVLRGVVTTSDGQAQANATVTLVQSAEIAGAARAPSLVRWARTDSQGRYRFRVGAGTFEMWGPDHERQVPLKIDSQPEVVEDFQAKKK